MKIFTLLYFFLEASMYYFRHNLNYRFLPSFLSRVFSTCTASIFTYSIQKIIFFLFLIITPLSYANFTQENTREACQQLIDEAFEETNDKNYAIALEKLLKAEVMAEENNWDDKLWNIKNRIGIIYAYISNYGEALDYFQESFAITQNNKELYEEGAIPLSSMGILHLREKKYEDALHYLNRAYDILKRSDQKLGVKKNTVNNIASVYSKLNRAEKSLEILSEVEEPVGITRIDFLWKAIYIEALFTNGEVLKAQEMAEHLYTELNVGEYMDHREECYTCLVTLLSKIYAKLNKIDLAISYAKKGLKSNDELIDRIDLYENISKLYLQKNEYKIALQYKDSVLIATDSLSALINRNLYETNKVKFKTQEYQNEIKSERERQEAQQKLFIAIVIFGFVVFYLIYRGLKNKVIKQKQKAMITNLALDKEKKEHLLAEKQLETTTLKQQQLKHEIAEKNRELSVKALYLSSRNEIIKDIINSLETNSKVTQSSDTTRQIKLIKDFLKTDEHHNDFIKHFENVNPVFLRRLKEKHPQLTTNDIRFLCYIFMNLSLKEISMFLNITYNACEKRYRRIKVKMGLDKDITLYDYILSITV